MSIEVASDKIQHPFMIKALKKKSNKRDVLNGKKLNAFSKRSET